MNLSINNISIKLPESSSPMKTFVDLFCGIGGFREALEPFGLRCVFSSEKDSKTREAYAKQFGDMPQGDIRDINHDDIPPHDVLCAGFPCQTFSHSGNQQGLVGDGLLIYDVIGIARKHTPAVILLENVPNILSIHNGEPIKDIIDDFNRIGYRVHYDILSSSDYGIPQHRKRVYFVLFHSSNRMTYYTPFAPLTRLYLRDILEDKVDESLYVSREDISIDRTVPYPALKPLLIGTLGKGRQGARIYHPNGHSITLNARGGGVGGRTGLYLIKDRVRPLSIRECKRLMGFSDEHIVSDGSKGASQLGNAVIPEMVSNVFKRIRNPTGEQIVRNPNGRLWIYNWHE